MFSLGGDTTPLRRSLDKLSPQLEAAGRKMGERLNLGVAAGIAALGVAIVSTIKRSAGDAIADALNTVRESSRLDVTISEFQQIHRLAETTGASVSDLAKGLKAGGAAATELRKSMAALSAAGGGNASEQATASLAHAGRVGRTAWSGAKQLAGGALGWLVERGNVLTGAASGLWRGAGEAIRKRSLAAGYDVFTDHLAEGMTASDTGLTRDRLASARVRMLAKSLSKAEGAQGNKLTDEKARAATLRSELAALRVGSADPDELSRIGIAHGRSSSEGAELQKDANRYLREITDRLRGLSQTNLDVGNV